MPPPMAADMRTPGAHSMQELSAVARDMSRLGHDIVEVAGVLDQIDSDAQTQLTTVAHVGAQANALIDANAGVQNAAAEVERTSTAGQEILGRSLNAVRQAVDRSQVVARWVSDIETSMASIMNTLQEVEATNTAVAGISRQVNILAINAKIEAARAGDAGRGFAVVAEAINELSQQTAQSAARITDVVGTLTGNIRGMHEASSAMTGVATAVLADGAETDAALTKIGAQVDVSVKSAQHISSEAAQMGVALSTFAPAFASISQASNNTATGIDDVRQRMYGMIDTSEDLLQRSVEAGGVADDALFIEDVQARAALVAARFEAGLSSGQISEAALFSQTYTALPNTDPQQVMAPFTVFTDDVLPEIQEPALAIDRRVVFCAAVDVNGYLPTHNKMFSRPQSSDPVWNAAHARNRRLFDDRVGLKAGRNTRPFLMQVYRRDMGGGDFVMMKDVSAPITVRGRHWGGLRLAFRT